MYAVGFLILLTLGMVGKSFNDKVKTALRNKYTEGFPWSFTPSSIFSLTGHSIQSARLSVQSSDLCPPTTSPHLPFSEMLACGGGGGDQVPTKGQTH